MVSHSYSYICRINSRCSTSHCMALLWRGCCWESGPGIVLFLGSRPVSFVNFPMNTHSLHAISLSSIPYLKTFSLFTESSRTIISSKMNYNISSISNFLGVISPLPSLRSHLLFYSSFSFPAHWASGFFATTCLSSISSPDQNSPVNFLYYAMMVGLTIEYSSDASRDAKTCRPCRPVGAIFSGRC